MKKKRDMLFELTKENKNSRQLQTILILTAPTSTILNDKVNSTKAALENNLVVGYQQLKGEEAKKEINKIYGR